MTLSDLSIKNPVFAWMLMIGLIVFGWIGFNRMGMSLMPDVDFPVLTITTTWEGAAPEVMETEVTDPMEDAIMTVEGVKEVSSTSRQGVSIIKVELELDRNIDTALQEVQTKLAQAQNNLPRDLDPPVIIKANSEDHPILWLSLYGDKGTRDIMAYTHDFLKNQFTTISGVGEVILGGYIDPNLRIWLKADEMEKRELTVSDVSQAIALQHAEVPAGYIDTGNQELNVRVMGEANTVEEFKKISIPGRSGSPIWQEIRIGDVADVEDGLDEIRRVSRFTGIPAVGLGIKKQKGVNAVAVAKSVKKKVEQLQSKLPQGLHLDVVFDGTTYIEESTHELNFTLVLSALLTSLVCWLFLGSWSSTLNVLLAIPTSIIGAFTILYFMGFTLNTFTLLGLSLAIGIVVDDAIMVLENIVRYHEKGMNRVKAALVGAREISFAAMAASVAILAIFIPVVFMQGIIGKFFFQFGVTMSVAVMLSLLEALTLAPMRCSQYLQVAHSNPITKKVDETLAKWVSLYRSSLSWSLRNRWKVVAGALGFFVLSLSLVAFLKKEFVPPQDQGNFLVRLQTPIGSSIQHTDEVVKRAEAFMKTRPDIAHYYVAIGGFGGGEINTAMMFVTLHPFKKRPVVAPSKRTLTQQEIMNILRDEFNKIPGVTRAALQDLSLSGFAADRGYPIEFTIRGPDWDTLADLSHTYMEKLKESGLMVDIDTDYQLGMPEVRVVPDREKATARGVNVSEIGQTINAMIGGVRVGKYTQGGKRYDIRARLVDADRTSPEDINKIWVRNNRGELIRLSDVVTLNQKPSLFSISRKNRERAISIFANVAPGKSQSDAIARVNKIGKEMMPDGYRVYLSGSAETFKESFRSLILTLVLGLLVAYMVLGSQFNSFIHPLTVLMALPFSVTGAFIGLLIGGQSLNMYSMIGIVLLMGIVKKNSILLVDFTNEKRREGLGLTESLLEACPLRLRPILMTSFATIAGALPAAMGFGPGAETRIPMALTVIGGVSVSTFLTLFVVPCVYSLLGRFESHKHAEELKEVMAEFSKS